MKKVYKKPFLVLRKAKVFWKLTQINMPRKKTYRTRRTSRSARLRKKFRWILISLIGGIPGLIAIFNFVTGKNSLPEVFLGNNTEKTALAYIIPGSALWPSLIICLSIIFIFFFVAIFKASGWLGHHGAITRRYYSTAFGKEVVDKNQLGDDFFFFAFMFFGFLITYLLFSVFFGNPFVGFPDNNERLLQYIILNGIVLFPIGVMCQLAIQTASKNSKKR